VGMRRKRTAMTTMITRKTAM